MIHSSIHPLIQRTFPSLWFCFGSVKASFPARFRPSLPAGTFRPKPEPDHVTPRSDPPLPHRQGLCFFFFFFFNSSTLSVRILLIKDESRMFRSKRVAPSVEPPVVLKSEICRNGFNGDQLNSGVNKNKIEIKPSRVKTS